MEEIRKMLMDLLKMSKILVDFLSFLEKSVEFFAPNTDWHIALPRVDRRYASDRTLKDFSAYNLAENYFSAKITRYQLKFSRTR